MSAPRPLRLLAEDAEDLAVISAALQDAVTRVGDIRYDARGRKLTVAFNRFRWEGERRERVRCGLQLNGVLGVQARKLRREAPAGVISLLAVTFEPGADPGGTVTFSFSGDADLRCEVECVDAVLADVSQPWPTRARPGHQDD